MHCGADVVMESGQRQLRRSGTATRSRIAFVDHHAQSGAGEGDGGGQPVGPRTDDHGVELGHAGCVVCAWAPWNGRGLAALGDVGESAQRLAVAQVEHRLGDDARDPVAGAGDRMLLDAHEASASPRLDVDGDAGLADRPALGPHDSAVAAAPTPRSRSRRRSRPARRRRSAGGCSRGRARRRRRRACGRRRPPRPGRAIRRRAPRRLQTAGTTSASRCETRWLSFRRRWRRTSTHDRDARPAFDSTGPSTCADSA